MMRMSMLAAVVTALAFAQTPPKLAVFQLEPVGAEARTGQVVTLLLREAFAKTQKYDLVSLPETVGCYPAAPACSIGRELGADKALIGTLMQLGNKYTISFQLLNVADGRVEFSDRIATTQVEEMDVVADRIVTAIVENRPISKTIEVGKVIESEVPAFKTREPKAFLVARTGYTYTYDDNESHRAFTLEGSVAYELKEVLTEAVIGGGVGGEGAGLRFDVLIHKILSKHDIAPYLGGGVGVHAIAHDYGETGDGPALVLSGGVMGFRTYGFRILANGRVGVTFADEMGAVPEYAITFGIASPGMGTGRVSGGESLGMCIGGCLGACFLLVLAATLS